MIGRSLIDHVCEADSLMIIEHGHSSSAFLVFLGQARVANTLVKLVEGAQIFFSDNHNWFE